MATFEEQAEKMLTSRGYLAAKQAAEEAEAEAISRAEDEDDKISKNTRLNILATCSSCGDHLYGKVADVEGAQDIFWDLFYRAGWGKKGNISSNGDYKTVILCPNCGGGQYGGAAVTPPNTGRSPLSAERLDEIKSRYQVPSFPHGAFVSELVAEVERLRQAHSYAMSLLLLVTTHAGDPDQGRLLDKASEAIEVWRQELAEDGAQ
jgi:hypothetical protein